jgi:hypothetical protein
MPTTAPSPIAECDHNSLPIVQTFAACATVGSEEAPNEKLASVRHPVGSGAGAPVRPGDPDPHHVSSARHVERNVRIDLVVCGCMPGNMNTVRKSSWYDLITKGLANSGLTLEELETPADKIERYSRPEDAAAATGAAASTAVASVAQPAWQRTPAAPEESAASLLRPSDPADDGIHQVRTVESVT